MSLENSEFYLGKGAESNDLECPSWVNSYRQRQLRSMSEAG